MVSPARPAFGPSPQPRARTDTSGISSSSVDSQVGLVATPVRALLRREPVTVPEAATIRQAASQMREQRVSAVLVVAQERLVGIVTDRDLRNRVIAEGMDTARPVMDAATARPLSIDVRSTAFDALLLMARQNIHHVPVVDGGHLVGMITATDLAQQHTSSAVFIVGDIDKQESVGGLQQASARIRQLQCSLAAADATAYATGQVITAMTDALTRRLLQLAEVQLGPPPVPYAWVAAGSQARCEQTAKSDQDNCLILDDAYDETRHGDYFRELSTFVCSGLDACGYEYCPGEMMAMTSTWRQPHHRWREYFRGWISEPEPKALMLTCVFFDMRLVSGTAALLDDLRSHMLQLAKGNSIFLAYMVSNAMSRRPPISVFGRITPARSGPQRGKVDLKHLGIVPIVDLARVYTLAGGQAAVNTFDRLEVAALGNEVSEQSARDLRDALEYLSAIRIQHQVRQMMARQQPDSLLTLGELSNFQRTQLKEAFLVIQRLQAVLAQRHQSERL